MTLHSSVRKSSKHLLLPEWVTDVEGPWSCLPTILDNSKISKAKRQAHIPPPYTEAQQLARLHELMHAKESPEDWLKVRTRVLSMGDEEGIYLDADACLKMSKMVEENRIDWILWHEKHVDMRPCREALKWEAMSVPDDNPLEATAWVLQLAWTVWGSEGIWDEEDIPGFPGEREVKANVKEFFTGCWKIVTDYANHCEEKDIGRSGRLDSMLLGVLAEIYLHPTHEVRDRCAFELATYFPKEEDYQQPPPSDEEQELQEAIEELADEEERAEKEDRQGGMLNAVDNRGHWEYHDHTKGRRRPRVRVRKRFTAYDEGTVLKFLHRYTLDQRVFGRRARQTGSILIDNSGSMNWTNKDMEFLLDHMPQLWIAGYHGVKIPNVYGRLCIYAKEGIFNEFTGLDAETNGGNEIDLEALRELAKQPEPRFWLSDGGVVGGILKGKPHPLYPSHVGGSYFRKYGLLIHEINKLMRQANILRIPAKSTMVRLFQKRRVLVYKDTVLPLPNNEGHLAEFPDDLRPLPVYYQL